MREPARDKATRLLVEGRVIVEQVHPHEVTARARGDGRLYLTGWRPGAGGRCTWPARSTSCAHALPLRLVVAVDLEGEPA